MVARNRKTTLRGPVFKRTTFAGRESSRTRGGAAAFGDWRSCWNVVLDTGVDAVFVDQPDLLTGLLAARRTAGAAVRRA